MSQESKIGQPEPMPSWSLSPLWKRILKFFAWFIIVDIAIVLLVTLVMHLKVSSAEKRYVAEWNALVGPIDEGYRQEFPATVNNAAAADLDKALKPLGQALTPGYQANAGHRQAFEAVGWNEVLGQNLERPRGVIQLQDPVMLAYLESHAAELDALLVHLEKGQTVTWAFTPGDYSSPLPSLRHHLDTQRLLLAWALLHTQEGRDKEAIRAFRGAMTMRQNLQTRPELISQLIALSEANMQMAAARKLPLSPEEWQDLGAAFDHRASLNLGIRSETHMHWMVGQDPAQAVGSGTHLSTWQRILFFNFVTRPWIRREGVEMMKANLRVFQADLDSPGCSVDLSTVEQEAAENMKGFLSGIIFGGLGNTYERYRHSQWQWDFTGQWVRFRSALQAHENPVALMQADDSTWHAWLQEQGFTDLELCENNAYVFLRESGEFVLTVERPDVGQAKHGMQIPLRASWVVPGLEHLLVEQAPLAEEEETAEESSLAEPVTSPEEAAKGE